MQNINFERLAADANSSDVIQTILFDAYGVSIGSWRRGQNTYSTKEHNGLKISRVGGQWIAKDYSGSTIGDSIGRGAWNLIKHAYGLQGKAAAEKLAVLAKIQIEYTEGSIPNHRTDSPPEPLKTYLPNTPTNGGEAKKYYDSVVYSDWSTPYGQSVLYFIQNKTKADICLIKTHFKPIESTVKDSKTTSYSQNKLAYVVLTEGCNKRIFRPFLKSQGNDKLPLEYGGNYLFGFFNLPEQCELIAFVGGEHDCIAFNSAFNRFGWYAVTTGGEMSNLPPELIELLGKRTKKIVTLFDNDKAGRLGMEKHTQAHNLQGIDLATYLNHQSFGRCEFENGINKTLNDICDIIGMENGEQWLKNIIKVELRTKKANNVLPYRPTFSSVWNVEFENYLGDTEGGYNYLKHYISLSSKLVLQAPTGTGKTYFTLLKLAQDQTFLESIGVERIVFFAPTNAIGLQQAEKHNLPFATGLFAANKSEIGQSRVVIATYDQAHKFSNENYLHDTLFVVDEWHEVINGFSYRCPTMRGVLRLMESAKHLLGITATPNRELIKHLNFGFAVATPIDPTTAQKVNLTPIILEKGTSKDILKDIETRRNADKVTVIKLNNFNTLQAFEKALAARHGSEAVTVFSSKFDETYLGNEHYQNLMNTGKLSNNIRFVLCTKLLEAGVNFEFKAEIFDVYPKATDELLQIIARPRIDRKTGINEVVNVYVYVNGTSFNKAKKDSVKSHFSRFLDGKGCLVPNETETHLSGIKNSFEVAKKVCEVANSLPNGGDEIASKAAKQNDLCIYRDENTGDWGTDILAILGKAESKLQSVLRGNVVAFFNEVKTLNNNVTIREPYFVGIEKDDEVRAEIKEIKEDATARKAVIAEKLADIATINDVLMIAASETKNPEYRAKFEMELGSKPTKAEIESAIKRTALETKQGEISNVAITYLQINEAAEAVKYADRSKPIKADDIKQALPQIIENSDLILDRLRRLGERLAAEREPMTKDSFVTILEGKTSNLIRSKVFAHREGKRDSILTKTQMFQIYTDAKREVINQLGIKKQANETDFQTVKKRFNDLFDVTILGKKAYKIGVEITPKNVLKITV